MNPLTARALAHRVLGRTQDGQLVLLEGEERTVLGRQGRVPPLVATITVHDPRFHRALLLHGGRGAAQAYMDGWWDCDDLTKLVRIAARNVHRFDAVRRRLRPLLAPAQHARALATRNTVARSRKQIAAHYDLGNDLYELFLDPTMMYSAALFATPATSLHDAQVAKLDRICDQLGLRPDDHLLEIGTGWGGLAVHAAQRSGCRVTTTTISAEQHAMARRRVHEAGLDGRVTVLRQDYRDLGGSYDKLVSVEMIEAVGWRDFGTFFKTCSDLLADDGLMLLQAITIDDRAYDVEKATRSFMSELIFPGGCLPSQAVIARNVARRTDLRMIGHLDMTADYAMTLARWRERFEAATQRLALRGYDERFRRLWRLYLSYCEGGFAEARIGVGQTLLAKPGHLTGPLGAGRELDPWDDQVVA